MDWCRTLLARGVAISVGLVLFCAIGYMGWELLEPPAPAESLALSAQSSAKLEEQQAQRLARLIEARQVPLAQVPWTARPAGALAAAVTEASVPWKVVEPVRPARLLLALVPRMRPRHDPKDPTPAVVRAAEVPWGRLARKRPARVDEAAVPSLKERKNPRRPVKARIDEAAVPWEAIRQNEKMHEIAAATVPTLRHPASPDPAQLAQAQVPWARDAARPAASHVSRAHVPRM